MANFNCVILVGRLTRDPELKYMANGTALCKWGMATSTTLSAAKDGQEKREETYFADCVLWGKSGETAAQYLKKGSPVLVTGRLHLNKWTDNSGNQKSRTEIVVDRFQFMEGRKPQGQDQSKDEAPPEGASPDVPW